MRRKEQSHERTALDTQIKPGLKPSDSDLTLRRVQARVDTNCYSTLSRQRSNDIRQRLFFGRSGSDSHVRRGKAYLDSVSTGPANAPTPLRPASALSHTRERDATSRRGSLFRWRNRSVRDDVREDSIEIASPRGDQSKRSDSTPERFNSESECVYHLENPVETTWAKHDVSQITSSDERRASRPLSISSTWHTRPSTSFLSWNPSMRETWWRNFGPLPRAKSLGIL